MRRCNVLSIIIFLLISILALLVMISVLHRDSHEGKTKVYLVVKKAGDNTTHALLSYNEGNATWRCSVPMHFLLLWRHQLQTQSNFCSQKWILQSHEQQKSVSKVFVNNISCCNLQIQLFLWIMILRMNWIFSLFR